MTAPGQAGALAVLQLKGPGHRVERARPCGHVH